MKYSASRVNIHGQRLTAIEPVKRKLALVLLKVKFDVVGARLAAACNFNALMNASYWKIGRRIVEFEQAGQDRAEYGEALISSG